MRYFKIFEFRKLMEMKYWSLDTHESEMSIQNTITKRNIGSIQYKGKKKKRTESSTVLGVI